MKNTKNRFFKTVISGLLAIAMLLGVIPINSISMRKAFAAASDLFFSEYIEGSSNNKAIEIYNGTGRDVDLSNYKIELYTNGKTDSPNVYELSGTLEDGCVFVIVNSASNDVLKGYSDAESTVTNFNGDDTIILSNGTTIIDVFGQFGFDPGSDWEGITANKTLIRKSSVSSGDSNKDDEFFPSVEWDVYDIDDFSHLGNHTMGGGSDDETPTSISITNILPANGVTVDKNVSIEFSASIEDSEASIVEACVYYSYNDTTIPDIGTKDYFNLEYVTTYKANYTPNQEGTFSYYIKALNDEGEEALSNVHKITVRDPNAGDDAITIAEARTQGTGTVKVKGIVTSTVNSMFIQDNTAGINLFTNKGSYNPKVGDEIEVIGTLTEYNGLLEIKDFTVTLISPDNALPAPQEVTISDIINQTEDEYEGERIKLNNVIIGASGTNTPLTDKDGNTINIYKMPALTEISKGDAVDVIAIVTVFKSWQLHVVNAEDITKTDLGPDTQEPNITHTAITDANLNKDTVVEATVTDDRNIIGVKLYYRTTGETIFKFKDMIAEKDMYSATIPKEELSIQGLEYYIEASDGTNTIVVPSADNFYSVNVSDEDILGPEITEIEPAENAVLDKANVRPNIKVVYNDVSAIDTNSVKLFVDNVDVTTLSTIAIDNISYTPDQDLSQGEHIIKIELSDTQGNQTIREWKFSIGDILYNIYFGQIHSHTDYSDGTGTATQAFTQARDEGKADFFAITDHSNWFDNEGDTFNETITDINQSTSQDWIQMHEIADQFNQDGTFVAIAGYEMTWSGSTGGWGHINTFNTPWFASRSNSNMDLATYYSHIAKDTDSISQLNHPGKTFGDFADFGYYSEETDKVVTLLEVGNGEGAVGSSGYFPSYEYYTRALDKGWHVAPTNNQDNHKGNFVTANETRTVALAPELTRESIYNAFRNRNVYATEDSNLEVMYKVNGKIMGNILDEPDNLQFDISINDPDTEDVINTVSVIGNGGTVITEQTFDSNTVDWEFELDNVYTYYYLRINQSDNDIAVTAPIWTGKVSSAGVSNVVASQDIVKRNSPVELTATVFNNGEDTLSDVKVTFYKNEVSAANKIGEASVSSLSQGQTDTAAITWIPEDTGSFKVYAVTSINLDGKERVSTVSTIVDVMNEEDIIKVVIDAGHMNYYVSGNYPGKVTKFKEILKDMKVMAVEDTDGLTAEDLSDASILVISSPQPTDYAAYSLTKSKLTDDEIEVVKEYINNGGTIIITSRADYKDANPSTDYDYQNSVQGNKILEAIGSNLRFNDDEIVDYTNNDGLEFRLLTDNYTGTKYDLTNDPGVTNYPFRIYSGCSVILKDGGNPEKVDFLVKGHNTTEVLDSDNDNDIVAVDKGNVYAVAAEELSNGGKVVVAGSTFFSDFEILGDNIFGNLQLTMNIIDWLKPEREYELKTIAEVRADDDKDGIPDNKGKTFIIEGRVTAETEAYTKANGRNNAFFEVLYVQDETGGITIFGSSIKEIPLGARVRVTGWVDQYGGDTELQLVDEEANLILLDDSIELVQAKVMNTGDSMKDEHEGWLVKVTGNVIKIEGQNIYVDDGSGEARVYVEGYIGDGTNQDNLGKWDPSIKEGDKISAIGLASEDPEGHRLRVRNTAEIVKVAIDPEDPEDPEDDSPGSGSSGSSSSGDGNSSGNQSDTDSVKDIENISKDTSISDKQKADETVKNLDKIIKEIEELKTNDVKGSINLISRTLEATSGILSAMADIDNKKEVFKSVENILDDAKSIMGSMDRDDVLLETDNIIKGMGEVVKAIEEDEEIVNKAKEQVLQLAQQAVEKVATMKVEVELRGNILEAKMDDISVKEEIKKAIDAEAQMKKALESILDSEDIANVKAEITMDISSNSNVRNSSIEIPGLFMNELKANQLNQMKVKMNDIEYGIGYDFLGDLNEEDRLIMQAEKIEEPEATDMDNSEKLHNIPIFDLTTKLNEETVENFIKPIELSFILKNIKEEDIKKLTVVMFDESNNRWVAVGGIYDKENNKITVKRSHFSKYTVMKSNKEFLDIVGHWGELQMTELLAKGILDDTQVFAPNTQMTREQFAAWIVRTYGLNLEDQIIFEDVDQSNAYYKEIAAAYVHGIVNGYSKNIFKPEATITRQEIATMVARAMKLYNNVSSINNSDSSKWQDSSSIANWAKEGTLIVETNGIFEGYEDGTFRPQANMTKAEGAAVIYRLYHFN